MIRFHLLLVNERVSINLCTFFMHRSIASLTWSHATNSTALLTAAISSGKDCIEADVVLFNNEPVLGHDMYDVYSKINTGVHVVSFQEYIREATRLLYSFRTHNAASVHLSDDISGEKKNIPLVIGLKIDFKDQRVVDSVISLLNTYEENCFNDIWLNADVIKGPEGPVPVFDGKMFLKQCSLLKRSYCLSLGWTTGSGSKKYSSAMIDEMKELLCDTNNTRITFPVRFCHAIESIVELSSLLNENECYSLTLWNSEKDDCKQFEKLQWFDSSRTYVDLYM